MENCETSVDAQAIEAAIERLTVVVGGVVNRLDMLIAAQMMIGANQANFPSGKLAYTAEDFESEWCDGYAAEHVLSPAEVTALGPLPLGEEVTA